MFGHLGPACRKVHTGRTLRELLEAFTQQRAEAAHGLVECTEVHNTPPALAACDAEMKHATSHSVLDPGSNVGPSLSDIEKLLKTLFAEQFRRISEMSKRSLEKQNMRLLERILVLEQEVKKLTPTLANQLQPPPPRLTWKPRFFVNSTTQTPSQPPPATPPITATQATQTTEPTSATPPTTTPVTAKMKRKCFGPPSPTQAQTNPTRPTLTYTLKARGPERRTVGAPNARQARRARPAPPAIRPR
ncbi:hypothetical protein FN846DRAFT_907108 [Sphaerosporella brunnea]|uniref:Uncharacterized protein n=1 Tax=Sphaerosporella brunnea TaxID=1250544 RepID=A0A5J5EX79_9PEZI|nr:hypothetical protein FN846DRAFT_907108 [Sphaerosporella brunnea]